MRKDLRGLSGLIYLYVIGYTLLALSSELTWPDHLTDIKTIRLADSESQLALGRKIYLKNAGIYELEMIPGVSGKRAHQIDIKREKFLAIQSQSELSSELQKLKGIGKVTAQRIIEHLNTATPPSNSDS